MPVEPGSTDSAATESTSDAGVGIVVVSHSRALARAAVDLASQMAGDSTPTIKVAAGLDETTLGTDATAVGEAITELAGCRGILVLVDLGSAILSAEMALEFLDPDLAAKVRITGAPLVEGLVVAVVMASTGADIDAVEKEALGALGPKQDQLTSR